MLISVTEINIKTDRKEQVRLFIIMAASFTYNLITLVFGLKHHMIYNKYGSR
jgi:hypothetical protein